MITVKVRTIYGKNMLTLDAGWKEIKEKIDSMENLKNEEVMLDFDGITVKDTLRHYNFKDLFSRKNLRFRFYNLGKEYEELRVMAIMDGYDESKIEHIAPEEKVKPTTAQKRITKEVDRVKPHIKIEGNSIYIRVYDVFKSLGNSLSAKYIEEAAREVIEKNENIKDMMIDLKGVAVANCVTEILVETKIQFNKEYGVQVAFDTDSDKVKEAIELYMHSKIKSKYGIEDKINEFRKIKSGTVGVLITYRKSRATDEFGRQGKGEISSARVAIFDRLVLCNSSNGDKSAYLIFTTYNGNKFYTREHWVLENDGEELDELESNIVKVKVSDVGLYDRFLGGKMHFSRPIQNLKSESITMRSVDENGKVISNSYTLPERVKAVLDDFGIYYDIKELNNAIEETNRVISES